jgi:trehalose 6-phosphate synthase
VAATTRPVVVVSNRGPLSGSGGLVGALGPAVTDSGATWVAAAITDTDRRAAEDGDADGRPYHLRLLTIDAAAYRAYYDTVSNSTLWYLYHGLFDAARRPTFDRRWHEAWERYRDVNQQFAATVCEVAPPDAFVLVHDYHLSLLGPYVTKERPDVRTVHFHHTPFCDARELRMLPDDVAGELLSGLAAYGACGFHVPRWADAFAACCEAVLGTAPRTFVSPAAANIDTARAIASSPAAEHAAAELQRRVGDRKLIVRNDRMELSKNVLRGFQAYDELLAVHPEWRERVVFAAYVYPSRQTLPDYLAYRAECEQLAARVNERWRTDAWTPILLSTEDDFAGAMAALRLADVVLVNPVRDGLNLVAKEAAAINERDGVLALSREAGAWDELGAWAFEVNPFDVGGTADVLHRALSLDADDRRERAAGLRAAATARDAQQWFADQAAAAAD